MTVDFWLMTTALLTHLHDKFTELPVQSVLVPHLHQCHVTQWWACQKVPLYLKERVKDCSLAQKPLWAFAVVYGQ